MSIISVNPVYPDLENKFPTDVDVIPKFIDPALEDLQVINQYYKYIDNDNLIAANAILDINPRLKQMCINANSLNPLVDAIISMQRYYIGEVEEYLVNIVKPKGNWNASSRYTKYDVVQYVNNGAIESYIGMVTTIPIGTLPTNLSYFTPLTLRGEQGASGIGLSPRGTWNRVIQYFKDDCVTYNNVLWAAKNDNMNMPPQDVSDAWDAVLRVPNQSIFSATEPNGQTVDGVWFKELGSNACEMYKMQSNGTYKLMLANANNALTANKSLDSNTVNGLTVKTAVPTGAKFTDTVYVHPSSHSATMITQNANNRFVTDIEKKNWSGKASVGAYTVTIGTNWINDNDTWVQNVTVKGMNLEDEPFIDIVLSGNKETDQKRVEEWNLISRITTSKDTITIQCLEDKPTEMLPLKIKAVR